MFESHKAVPSIPAYLICDAAFIRKYGLGDIHPGTHNFKKFEASGYLVSGRTFDELAAKINIDAAGLRDARTNTFAATGVDIDFGKGELELNRFNGDPTHKPNPCLGPIATAPFYAVAVRPADIAVSTGFASRRARARGRGQAHPRPLCLRQRHGLGHER